MYPSHSKRKISPLKHSWTPLPMNRQNTYLLHQFFQCTRKYPQGWCLSWLSICTFLTNSMSLWGRWPGEGHSWVQSWPRHQSWFRSPGRRSQSRVPVRSLRCRSSAVSLRRWCRTEPSWRWGLGEARGPRHCSRSALEGTAASGRCCWSPSARARWRRATGWTRQRRSCAHPHSWSCPLSAASEPLQCGRRGIWSSRWLCWAQSCGGGCRSTGPKWGSLRQCGWLAGQGFAWHLPPMQAGTAGSQRHGPTQGEGGKGRHNYLIAPG